MTQTLRTSPARSEAPRERDPRMSISSSTGARTLMRSVDPASIGRAHGPMSSASFPERSSVAASNCEISWRVIGKNAEYVDATDQKLLDLLVLVGEYSGYVLEVRQQLSDCRDPCRPARPLPPRSPRVPGRALPSSRPRVPASTSMRLRSARLSISSRVLGSGGRGLIDLVRQARLGFRNHVFVFEELVVAREGIISSRPGKLRYVRGTCRSMNFWPSNVFSLTSSACIRREVARPLRSPSRCGLLTGLSSIPVTRPTLHARHPDLVPGLNACGVLEVRIDRVDASQRIELRNRERETHPKRDSEDRDEADDPRRAFREGLHGVPLDPQLPKSSLQRSMAWMLPHCAVTVHALDRDDHLGQCLDDGDEVLGVPLNDIEDLRPGLSSSTRMFSSFLETMSSIRVAASSRLTRALAKTFLLLMTF